MQINPNCSEIIAKLPVTSMEEAIAFIEKNSNIQVIHYDHYLGSLASGIEEQYNIIDPDNPNSPDFRQGSYIMINTRTGMNDEGKEEHIICAHQHTRSQLYPTIEKLMNEKKLDFDGYDGGSDFDYLFKAWQEEKNDTPPEDLHRDLREMMAILFAKDTYHTDLKHMIEVVSQITSCDEAFAFKKNYIGKTVDRIIKEEPQLRQRLQEHIEAVKEIKEEQPGKPLTDEQLRKRAKESMQRGAVKAILACLYHENLRNIFLQGGDANDNHTKSKL